MNRRRALADSNGPAYFMYDKDGLCQLVERRNTGNVRAEYTRGTAPVAGIGDMVAAKINTATTSYYQYPVYDHRGNVQRIVNDSGAVTGSFEYNAWGEKLLNQPPAEGTRFGFSAPAWITLNDDPDLELLLSPTRAYYCGIGRFMQRDPLGRAESIGNALTVTRRRSDFGTAQMYLKMRIHNLETESFFGHRTLEYIEGMGDYLARFVPSRGDPSGAQDPYTPWEEIGGHAGRKGATTVGGWVEACNACKQDPAVTDPLNPGHNRPWISAPNQGGHTFICKTTSDLDGNCLRAHGAHLWARVEEGEFAGSYHECQGGGS